MILYDKLYCNPVVEFSEPEGMYPKTVWLDLGFLNYEVETIVVPASGLLRELNEAVCTIRSELCPEYSQHCVCDPE